ncbi:helix-turn-helix domain-containing protein [Solibacillus sp. FSL R7-0668]|uniref:TrmB family transcriptional regulator n=1 Tax=Solibacillus sp. FSL R7-0668 TaxID=2921688 RepID=UPI0030F6FEC9
MRNQVTERLKRIGFTEYESKIYMTLLGSSALNGNEIANISGVPGPKVYSNMQNMIEKGFVSAVYDESNKKLKVKYIATPYEQILENFHSSVSNDVLFLKKELKKIEEEKPQQNLKQELYQIVDYDLTVKAIQDMIDSSSKSIYVCCWKVHQLLLNEQLIAAHKRGVKIVVLLFDQHQVEVPWKQFTHLSASIVTLRHLHEVNVVIDEKNVLISHLKKHHVFTVVSDSVALVQTTLNYIRHDIYVNRVLQDFYVEAIEKYGEDLKGLLDI